MESNMNKDIILELAEQQEKASFIEPFNPNDESITVKLSSNGAVKTFPFEKMYCLLQKDKYLFDGSISDDYELFEIEIKKGNKYLVRVNDGQPYNNGFFASSIEPKEPYNNLFFFNEGVKVKKRLTYLGNILEDRNIISREVFTATLEEYRKTRNARLGDILVEKYKISREDIEKNIRKMQKEGKIPPRARIGDILKASGLASQKDIEEALATQIIDKRKKIGDLLIEQNHITEEQLLTTLAIKFQLECIDLNSIKPCENALAILPFEMVCQLNILPIEIRNNNLVIATSNPSEIAPIDDVLRFYSNYNIEFVVAPLSQISKAITKYYNRDKDKVQIENLIGEIFVEDVETENEKVDLDYTEEPDSRIIKLVNNILIDGFNKGASDIHIEPGTKKKTCNIRFRVDGICYNTYQVSKNDERAFISRLKIMSHLDIAEHRRPQSGKILLQYQKKRIEYRIEVTPTVGTNEDAVLRILTATKPIPIDEIGLTQANLERYRTIVNQAYGIILCVGPTGSGKTTTLHSTLGQINTPGRKIWTAEDPVEITQDGLRQVQVNPKIGFTFQEALRSFLRADPDVIMIGEMRDHETAKIAIEASLTGHLVFSTLHTNSAPETLRRLIEMGVDPISFAEALLGILAQRLARKLCKNCKKTYNPSKQEYDEIVKLYGDQWFSVHNMNKYSDKCKLAKRIGCIKCDDIGYRGRIAIIELLLNSEDIKQGIKDKLSIEDLRKIAIQDGMRTLRMDGVHKIFEGFTDSKEIVRVC